jgi:hypothetical protein
MAGYHRMFNEDRADDIRDSLTGDGLNSHGSVPYDASNG